MKILIDGRLLSDKETGISRYTENLINIYIDLFGRKNIILIIPANLKKTFDDIQIIKTDLYPFNIYDFIRFHRFLEKIDFDVYHSMFYSNSFFKLKDKIYITTVHDLMYKIVPKFFYENKIKNFLATCYFDFIVYKSLKNSDFIISVSQTTKNDIKQLFNKDSIVIIEGVNKLKINENELQIDINIIKSKQYFLYVGNNRPHKNIKFLKECYLKSKTDKKLVIVGHKGKNLQIGNKEIIYTGFINDFTLKYLYENAIVFVFPSLYEGFGLPILEAINFNTFVFSSNGGALKEFGNYNIEYFAPNKGEDLINLLNNADNFVFDKNKKYKLLSKYNWNETKKQIQNFYQEFLKYE